MNPDLPNWLRLARELQSISQTGLCFIKNEYDRKNYQRLGEIAAEIIANYTQLEQEEILNNFALQPGYATPKIDIRCAAVRDNKILLVQEKMDRRWCLPGGWADVGEFPSEAIIRETKEESGFVVEPKKLVGVYDANRGGRPMEFYHAYKLIFLCTIVGGEPNPDHEILDVNFFPFDQLPPLSQNRTSIRHLEEIQKHLNNSQRPTFFD